MPVVDERSEYQRKIGVGERTNLVLRKKGQTRDRRVIVEEGPRAGQTAGYQTDHWDGRVDATVLAPTQVAKIKTHEIGHTAETVATPSTGVPLL